MSLQRKFLLLIGTLLLGVVGSIAAAGFALRFVHNDVATPFKQISIALGELGKTKRAIEAAADAMGNSGGPSQPLLERGGVRDAELEAQPRDPSPEEEAVIRSAIGVAKNHVARLEANEWYLSRIGVPTWSNLKQRLAIFGDGATEWFDAGNEAQRVTARRAAYELHELIEKTELRILDDASTAVDFSADLRSSLGWWLVAVFTSAALTSVLAVALLRRWVRTPVAQLREAAARIAAGDFMHRVNVVTGDEIGQLMAEVNHMAAMVDRYQHEAVERERFAAIGQMVRRIVHNVRNPLAGIRGLAEVTRLDTAVGSDQRENLDLIVSTVDTFERWLTQLLESTRPLEVFPVKTPLLPWVREVLRSHESGARAKGVQIVLDDAGAPVEAEFDARHLEHALAAVLANAIDASVSGMTVTVHVAAAVGGEAVELVVCDEGPGVPPAVRERIFEPHFTTKAKGTGIGLAIARQILRSHGGSITLDSPNSSDSTGPGACFRLQFPVQAHRSNDKVAENSHQSG
jgi:signal transduction histidine kinase